MTMKEDIAEERLAAPAVRPCLRVLSPRIELREAITAVMLNAGAALRWINGDSADLTEAKRAIESILAESRRAADAIGEGDGFPSYALLDMPAKQR